MQWRVSCAHRPFCSFPPRWRWPGPCPPRRWITSLARSMSPPTATRLRLWSRARRLEPGGGCEVPGASVNDTIDCTHITVNYRGGDSYDVFEGRLVKDSRETITIPRGNENWAAERRFPGHRVSMARASPCSRCRKAIPGLRAETVLPMCVFTRAPVWTTAENRRRAKTKRYPLGSIQYAAPALKAS